MKLSIGQLIDELITTSMRVWTWQEIIAVEKDDKKVAVAARKALTQNARRTKLIQEIDERLASGDLSQIHDGTKTFQV
jgi:hypothetical protein